jgi:hypothetical protein
LGESLGLESCSRENEDLFSRVISKKMSRGRERKQGRRERSSKEGGGGGGFYASCRNKKEQEMQ